MDFRTPVAIPPPDFQIEPLEEMLFVGSCFADSIGQRFVAEQFRATVNPYGTMYNPASVFHSVERWLLQQPADNGRRLVVFITLGTNHIYRLKATGEIVDNCQKRPQRLFSEEELTAEQCALFLRRTVALLQRHRRNVYVVFTVSPIRYRKYGYHESQLSKATLLLAVNAVATTPGLCYFPAYEIVMDELRDYRFYADDMLHPSPVAVEYIWQQLAAHYLSPRARQFLVEWAPLKAAFAHRPLNADSADYRQFLEQTKQKAATLLARYGKEYGCGEELSAQTII
jgi:hypothetical protein